MSIPAVTTRLDMTKQDMRKGKNTGSPVSVFAGSNPFGFSLFYYLFPLSARSPASPRAFNSTPHISGRTAQEREQAITHQDVKSNRQPSSPAIAQESSHCACPAYTPPQAFSHSQDRH